MHVAEKTPVPSRRERVTKLKGEKGKQSLDADTQALRSSALRLRDFCTLPLFNCATF